MEAIEGEYFAQFEFTGVQHATSFAMVQSYDRGNTHLEMNFSDPNIAKLQESADINDSGEGCHKSEPQCYRSRLERLLLQPLRPLTH
jgi:hypothetical protein